MKLTKKQQKELRILKWWRPSNVRWGRITDEQVEAFFGWSDNGIPHRRNTMVERDGFCALFWAKNRRDLHISSYLEDWGDTMNAWSFTGFPLEVKEDVAKRIGKPETLKYYGRKK